MALFFGMSVMWPVKRTRAGLFPVRTATRVGEHTRHAEYAYVQRIPSAASWSMFGVSINPFP